MAEQNQTPSQRRQIPNNSPQIQVFAPSRNTMRENNPQDGGRSTMRNNNPQDGGQVLDFGVNFTQIQDLETQASLNDTLKRFEY